MNSQMQAVNPIQEVSGIHPVLADILQRKRPSGSESEKRFVHEVIDRIPGIRRDGYGNRILRVGLSQTTMISVHTDTVHWEEGRQDFWIDKYDTIRLDIPPRPRVEMYKGFSILGWLDDCLGADDGAGVYAAMRMIEARVPALYVFHRDEEIGGRGSQYIAEKMQHLLLGIERAVALDRRGTTDIVVAQMGDRCASDEFAAALGYELNLGHEPAIGSFTDTANYAHIVPECTNISVGYDLEHSEMESLDISYLETLIDRLCSIDWEGLPTVRKPASLRTPKKVKRSKGGK